MPRRKVFKDSDDEEESILFSNQTEEVSHPSKDLEQEQDSDASGDLVDSDSDDAPEGVSFSAGKEDALKQVQAALKQIEGENRKKKLKRRQQDELFKIQKEKKIEELSKRKLPEDFLDELSSQPVVEKQSIKIKPVKRVGLDEEEGEENSDDDFADEADDEEDTEDYISLGNDRLAGFKVVAIREELKKSKPSSQTAAEFKQKMLFGDRVKREPMSDKLAKKIKKKARFRSS